MSFQVLPGVKTTENDLSQIIRSVRAGKAAFFVDSDKGPVGESKDDPGWNQVTSTEQFVNDYGIPKTRLELATVKAIRATNNITGAADVRVKRVLPRSGGNIDAKWGGIEFNDDNGTKSVRQLNDGVVYPLDNKDLVSGTQQFRLYATNPSDENSNVGVKVLPDQGENNEFLIEEYLRDDSSSDWSLNDEYLVSQEEKFDQSNRQMFIEDRLEANSDYLRAVNNSNLNTSPKKVDTVTALGGGTSGSTVTTDDLVTGAQDLRNADEIDARFTMTGGEVYEDDVIFANELMDIVASRRDMVALIDTPHKLKTADLTDFLDKLVVPSSPDNAGSYAAIYGPWEREYELFRGKTVTRAPTGSVAKIALETSINQSPWFAFAGTRRGRTGANELAQSFSESDATTYYENRVNPIRQDTFLSQPTIWGQKTYQQFDSALDRLNVRMLMIIIEKSISQFARSYVFEFNDPYTRNSLETEIDDYLGSLGRGALNDYDVKVDEENNPPEVRERNELKGDIIVDPVRVAEFIELTFSIVPPNEVSFETVVRSR